MKTTIIVLSILAIIGVFHYRIHMNKWTTKTIYQPIKINSQWCVLKMDVNGERKTFSSEAMPRLVYNRGNIFIKFSETKEKITISSVSCRLIGKTK